MRSFRLVFIVVLSALLINILASTIGSNQKDFTCHLSDVNSMKISWTIDYSFPTRSVITTISTSSPTSWFSFAVIKKDLLMIPRSGHIHNIFLYSPDFPLLGRYFMRGIGLESFPPDQRSRYYSNLIAAQHGPSGSYMKINYTESPNAEYTDDPVFNIRGENYVIFAIGDSWPEYHRDRNMRLINWEKGTCEVLDGGSPFLIFIALAAVVIFVRLVNCFSLLGKINNYRVPFMEEYSYTGLFVVAIHLGICIAVLITNLIALDSTYYAALAATGKVAMMSFWIALIPSSKNIVVYWLTGVPFERSMKYHKLAASFALVSGLVHMALEARYNGDFFFKTSLVGNLVNPLYGTLGFISAYIMGILAMDPIRKTFYEVFLFVHYMFPIPIIFLSLHVPYAIYGFIPGIFFHFIDKCIRLYQFFHSKPAVATRVDKYTILQVPINKENKLIGGEYYFLRIGAVSPVEWHPFSVSGVGDEEITFHIEAQKAGSWTAKLHDLKDSNLNVNLDGPYGNIRVDMTKYSSMTIIAGGIGITPFIHILQRLCSVSVKDMPTSLQTINLHWSMRGTVCLHLFADKIKAFTSSVAPKCYVHIYDTTAEKEPEDSSQPVEMHKGRPDIEAIITQLKNSNSSLLVCGPKKMVETVSRYSRMSNVDFHEEVFGY